MASPILAAILSFLIPGVGQFYAGHMFRGIGVFILAAIVAIFSLFSGSLIIAVVAAIDAYSLASKSN